MRESAQPARALFRALIVENDYDNRQQLRTMLQDQGGCVAEEENGSRAADRALNQHFDVIFLAAELPILRGEDTTKLLRLAGISAEIVALSVGSGTTDSIAEPIGFAGCDAVLSCPATESDVRSLLRQILPKSRLLQTSAKCSSYTDIERDVKAIRQACMARDLARVSSLANRLQDSIEVSDLSSLQKTAERLKSSSQHTDCLTNEENEQFEEIAATVAELQELIDNLQSNPLPNDTSGRSNVSEAGIQSTSSTN